MHHSSLPPCITPCQVCGLQPYADAYKAYIEKLGLEIISEREARLSEPKAKENPRKNPEFVQALVDLHTKATEITETVRGTHNPPCTGHWFLMILFTYSY